MRATPKIATACASDLSKSINIPTEKAMNISYPNGTLCEDPDPTVTVLT